MTDLALNCYYELTLGNFIFFLETISKNLPHVDNAISRKADGSCWLDLKSEFPLFNGYLNFSEEIDWQKVIVETKNYFSEQAFIVWRCLDQDPDHTENLDKIFQAENFQSMGVYQGILADLNNIKNITQSEFVAIKPVLTEETYNPFLNILNEVFELNQAVLNEFKAALRPDPKNKSYTNYLAYYQGEPAGILTSFVKENVVGLYNGATLAKFRKKGVLSALLMQALKDAKRSGCNQAVGQLMSSNMAWNTMNKIGFKVVSRFMPYLNHSKT